MAEGNRDDETLLAIIGPVVRGQIHSFRLAHGDTLTGGLAASLAKRIINDLTRGSNAARLRAATVGETAASLNAGVASSVANRDDCACGGRDGVSCPGHVAPTHPTPEEGE